MLMAQPVPFLLAGGSGVPARFYWLVVDRRRVRGLAGWAQLRALPLHAGADLLVMARHGIRNELAAQPLRIARTGLLLLRRALRGREADRPEEGNGHDRSHEPE